MWVALFSQTGSEIVNLSERLYTCPNLVLTNNRQGETWHPGIVEMPTDRIVATHAQIVEHLMNMEPCLVTLHGYLRILPPEVCERHTVVNGHPGDIVNYPELKGKDPQKKALELGLPSTGVVIHKAVAEVDAGEILKHGTYDIPADITEEQLILNLKELQLRLWVDYFWQVLPEALDER